MNSDSMQILCRLELNWAQFYKVFEIIDKMLLEDYKNFTIVVKEDQVTFVFSDGERTYFINHFNYYFVKEGSVTLQNSEILEEEIQYESVSLIIFDKRVRLVNPQDDFESRLYVEKEPSEYHIDMPNQINTLTYGCGFEIVKEKLVESYYSKFTSEDNVNFSYNSTNNIFLMGPGSPIEDVRWNKDDIKWLAMPNKDIKCTIYGKLFRSLIELIELASSSSGILLGLGNKIPLRVEFNLETISSRIRLFLAPMVINKLSELTLEERMQLTDWEYSNKRYGEWVEHNKFIVRKARKWLEGTDISDLYEVILILADKFEEELNNDPTIVYREQAKKVLFHNIETAIEGIIKMAPYDIKLENYKKYVDDLREPYYMRNNLEERERKLSRDVTHAIFVKFADNDPPRSKWMVRHGDRDRPEDYHGENGDGSRDVLEEGGYEGVREEYPLDKMKKFIKNQSLEFIIKYIEDQFRSQRKKFKPIFKYIRKHFSDRLDNYYVDLGSHIFNEIPFYDFFLTKDGAYFAFAEDDGGYIVNTLTDDKLHVTESDMIDGNFKFSEFLKEFGLNWIPEYEKKEIVIEATNLKVAYDEKINRLLVSELSTDEVLQTFPIDLERQWDDFWSNDRARDYFLEEGKKAYVESLISTEDKSMIFVVFDHNKINRYISAQSYLHRLENLDDKRKKKDALLTDIKNWIGEKTQES